MADYIELLRTDLADMALIERSRRSIVQPDICQAELAGLGVLIAVCTTLANKLAEETIAAGNAIALFEVFRPTRRVGQIARGSSSLPEPSDIEHAIRLADERIDFACRITCAWVHSERSTYTDFVTTAILADAWRNACDGIATLFDYGDLLKAGPEEARAPTSCDATLRILIEARDGGTPCCDDAGGLSIPGWAERRKVQRIKLSLKASLVAPDRHSYPAEIANASQQGLGLISAAMVHVGSRVDVAVQGRILGATVKWKQHDHLGVRLDTPLGEEDELLRGGA